MVCQREDKEDIKVYGQMACEGSPDCCEETADRILMRRGSQGLNEDLL